VRDDMAIRRRREIELLNVAAVYHGQLISRRTAHLPCQNHPEVADINFDGGDQDAGRKLT
jgi:hypothetical protein